MVDQLKIKQLSAKNTNVRFNPHLNISHRIFDEHLFVSFDECLKYLYHIIFNEKINQDDLFFVSSDESKVLFVNIIDESISSMIYEAFKLREKNDLDLIGYACNQLDQFMINVSNLIDKLPIKDKKILVLKALLQTLSTITIILSPSKQNEELRFGQVALYYYNLLYTTHTYLSKGEDKKYFNKHADIYAQYIMMTCKERNSMGVLEFFTQGEKCKHD